MEWPLIIVLIMSSKNIQAANVCSIIAQSNNESKRLLSYFANIPESTWAAILHTYICTYRYSMLPTIVLYYPPLTVLFISTYCRTGQQSAVTCVPEKRAIPAAAENLAACWGKQTKGFFFLLKNVFFFPDSKLIKKRKKFVLQRAIFFAKKLQK